MRPVWLASDRVAKAMCRSPLMRDHAFALANWRIADPPDHVRKVLHEDPFSDVWESHPLLMGLRFAEHHAAQDMDATPEGKAWTRGAVMIAIAFGRIVEHLRSRLPGYPSLRVPHVLPSSVRCQQEGFFFGPGFPWLAMFRQEAPQLQPEPDVSTLELDRAAHAGLQEAIRELGAALRASDAWRTFADLAQCLTQDDLDELRHLRRLYRDDTRPEIINAVERRNLMRRHRYAQAVMESVLEQATGTTADYLRAFERVDELISSVARVMQDIVVFGPPIRAGRAVEGTWRPGRFGYRVRLTTDSDEGFLFRPGMVEIDSEIAGLQGVVLADVQAVNLGSLLSGFRASLSGELLPGSAETLVSGPAW
jgi:hypothetical protein